MKKLRIEVEVPEGVDDDNLRELGSTLREAVSDHTFVDGNDADVGDQVSVSGRLVHTVETAEILFGD